MHFFTFAEKDATLYEGSATQSRNTGLDEILEVRKDMNADGSVVNVSRTLIKFDLSDISSSIVAGIIPENARYYLNLYDANSKVNHYLLIQLVSLGFKVMVGSLTNQQLLMVVLGDIVTEKQPEHNGLVVQIILVELGLINMKHHNHLITKQLIWEWM